MSEAIKEQAAELLKTANKTTIEMVDFLKQQAPDLCNQYLTYYSGTHIVYALILLFVAGICFYMYRKCKKFLVDNKDDFADDGGLFVIQYFCLAAIWVLIPLSLNNIWLAILPYIAPKMVILDLITQIVNGKSIL